MSFMRWIIMVGLLFVPSLLFGQTAVQVLWDPPLPAESGITSYNLYVDLAAPISVPVTIDPTCACIKAPIAVSVGSHTVRVTGVYLLIDTDPTSATETQSAVITFTLNNGGQIRNVKVTK